MNRFFYHFFCFLLLTLSLECTAQTQDNFSDGNFTSNPNWVGDDSLFKVNSSFQLQLAATASASSEAYLSTKFSMEPSLEWNVFVRLAFAPSTQNTARFYLCSDTSNLKSTQGAYYIQLGGSTGSSDSISLYKQTPSGKICLLKGRPSTFGKTTNSANIKVKRDATGLWQLFTDTSNKQEFVLEGSMVDTSLLPGNNLGFWCKFTSGNNQNFYFDNVYVGAPLLDTLAPQITQINLLDSTHIECVFNEKIISPSPSQIGLQPAFKIDSIQLNGLVLKLVLATAIPQDLMLQITLNQLSDLAGNKLDTQLVILSHFVKKGELILTEFMADPEPVVAMPNAEFVEVFNSSSRALSCHAFSLSDASGSYFMPAFTLGSNQFAIACKATDSSLFAPFGQIISMPNFPSLNNSGDQLILKNQFQQTLDSISYDLNWYQTLSKQNGGYSLELINANLRCKGSQNWQACNSNLGATPGQKNSNWQTQADTIAPIIKALSLLSETELEVDFNEAILLPSSCDSCILLNGIPSSFLIKNSNSIVVQTLDSMKHLEHYSLLVKNVKDCSGNSALQSQEFVFYQTKPALQNQLLMTEIYFDESKVGQFPNADFIELFNRSKYALNLKGMRLSDEVSSHVLPEYCIKPNEYLIVCHQKYEPDFRPFGNVLGLATFPSLSSRDVVTLKDSFGFILNQVQYTQSFLDNTAALFSCSIELVNIEKPCEGSLSWQACRNKDGATPGSRNSVVNSSDFSKEIKLLRLFCLSDTELVLRFNSSIDSLSIAQKGNFVLNEHDTATYFSYYKNSLSSVLLRFANPIDSVESSILTILDAQNCGQKLGSNMRSEAFQNTLEPMAGDIVINEILVNPKTGYYDFLELYNTSAKTLNLTNLVLFKCLNEQPRQDITAFASNGIMILPFEYLVITEKANLLLQQYPNCKEGSIIEHSLPAMNDDEGIVVLQRQDELCIDSIAYSDKMHLSFLNQTEGISLEKINPFELGINTNNWTSASEESGYGTPGQRNSQYSILEKASASFKAKEPYFSPDEDGQQDVMVFSYCCNQEQSVGSLSIYSSEGVLTKTICRSRVLGTEGELHWFGETNEGKRAGIGNYIALWQVFTEDGMTSEKRVCFSLLSK
ncbi:MAG: hypothetical protein CFE21_03250 [Bacteroidetes bacterium B1(2017)]|nr:MAG: hypothetical protein CFE21_03250 [Bacteroidetes bacterium B1(2017)]